MFSAQLKLYLRYPDDALITRNTGILSYFLLCIFMKRNYAFPIIVLHYYGSQSWIFNENR
jgi:hypothetical protein